ncbi:MAG: EI24 domain-containing protein, partial [Campylobacterales bacterium]
FLIAVIATNAIVAGFYAPFVISYLHKKYYSDIEVEGFGSLVDVSVYFVKTLGLFLFLLLLAIPLYFIPVVGFLVPILIFFWFYKKNIVFDVGSTMLNKSEYKEFLYLHRNKINIVSFVTYLIGYIPIINLFAAVPQLLAVAHLFFSLKRGV